MLDTDARRKAILDGMCTACGGHAKAFYDQRSVREYQQSGLCQGCQDAFFIETTRDLELHSGDMTIMISVGIRRNGSAIIEAFYSEPCECDDCAIGFWTVDAEARKQIAPLVIRAVEAWLDKHGMTIDDPSEPVLVYAELRRILATP